MSERRKSRQKKMTLEEQVRLLSTVDVLEPLSEEELEDLGKRAPDRYLDEGEVFHTPEDSGERLYLLKRGRARVYEVVVEEDGREAKRTLAVAEGGHVLGEMMLTGQHLSGVYAEALEPSVVAILERGDLERLVFTNPEVGMRIIRMLSRRLRETETRLADLTNKDVPARLAGLILRLLENEGVMTDGTHVVPTRYTHQQLADMIGSTRHVVTRGFAKLREEGAVAPKEDRYIRVADLEALKRAAEA